MSNETNPTPALPSAPAVQTGTPAAPPTQAMVVARPAGPPDRFSYEPESRAEAWRLAQTIAGTPFCPKGLVNAEAVTLVLILGRELGFTTMQSLRHLYVVNGRPSISTAAKTSLVQQSPECEYLRPVELSNERAIFETKRKGHKDPVRLEWTIADAVKANLASKPGPWKEYPRKMLAWRCQSDLCDLVYPDLVSGLTTAEEAQDMPPERDLGSRRTTPTPMILPGDDSQEAPPEPRPATETNAAPPERPAPTQTPPGVPAAPAEPTAAEVVASIRGFITTAKNEVALAKAREMVEDSFREGGIDSVHVCELFTLLLAQCKTRPAVNQVADMIQNLEPDLTAGDIQAMAAEVEQAKGAKGIK